MENKGEGKKLDKPFLVTRNTVKHVDKASLEVVGVCREKIIFNKRPAPVLRQDLKKMKMNS